MFHSNIRRLTVVSLLALSVVVPSAVQAQKGQKKKETPTGVPVMWREHGDIESLNLLGGPGGETMKPDLSKVSFIEKKTGGYSEKYRVRDAAGNEWVAKFGKEAQPDTAANRLLWAVGYETEIAHLIPSLTIEGLVIDGKKSFENVRLEARPKSMDRIGDWKWDDNPFKGKPELQGLKIMMALINNWDIKDSNNEVLHTRNESTGESELRYIISDLGGSFGKTGGIVSRSRNKPTDFVKADFIESVKGNVIDFNYGGKNKSLFKNITVEDARWIGTLLGRLSDEQIKDAFRAANYTPEDVEALSLAVKERINALNNLSATVASRKAGAFCSHAVRRASILFSGFGAPLRLSP